MFSKLIIPFLVLTISFSCRKVKQNTVLIVGHAACGLENIRVPFQDNTKEGIEYAFSYNKCGGVELDLQLSSDNELILFHNSELSKNTNKSGCINDFTSFELLQTEYATLNKEKITALNQLTFLTDKTYYLDIRHLNYCKQSIIDVNKYISALSNVNLPPKIFLTVSSVQYIEPLKLSGYRVIYVADTESEALNVMNNYNLDGVELRLKNITTTFVEKYKSDTFSVGIYDVRAAKSIQKAINMGPTYMSTDDLKRTINCLK